MNRQWHAHNNVFSLLLLLLDATSRVTREVAVCCHDVQWRISETEDLESLLLIAGQVYQCSSVCGD